MMREILFKAKDKKTEEWVEGSILVLDWESDYVYIVKEFPRASTLPVSVIIADNMVLVDKETICQYTGKSDEDGKKIFEGDIVGFIDLYYTESGYSESSCLGEVVWSEEECCFHVINRLSAESWEVLDECKVVGNVFDNKELLDEL